MRNVLAVTLAAVLSSGCFLAGSSTSEAPGSRSVITESEIRSTEAHDAYEVVEELRPLWLESRGPTSIQEVSPSLPIVFVDGTRVGELRYLRNINVSDVQEIRFLSPGEAANRFGMGYPRGIIHVISDKGA